MPAARKHDTWDRLAPAPRKIAPWLAAQVLLGSPQFQSGWCFLFGGSCFLILIWNFSLSGWRSVLDGAVPAIFQAIGLVTIFSSLVKGRMRLRLLSIGLPANGTLIKKVGYWDPESTEFEMTFEYRTRDGVVRYTTVKTWSAERLEDHPEEALFYDPECPEIAVLVDDLPGTVILDEAGQPDGASFAFVFLPAATVLIPFWLILFWLIRLAFR